jgi:hypothetical protein
MRLGSNVSIVWTDTVLLLDRLRPGRILPKLNLVSLGWRFRRGSMPFEELRNDDGGDEPMRLAFSCRVRESSRGMVGMGGGECGASWLFFGIMSLNDRQCLRVVMEGCMN